MKRYIITAASGLLVFFILFSCLSFLVPSYYILTRYTPDFSFDTQLLAPEGMQKDKWTKVETVSYQDGGETERTVIRKEIFSDYSVRKGDEVLKVSTVDGSGWTTSGSGFQTHADYLGSSQDRFVISQGDYSQNAAKKVTQIKVYDCHGLEGIEDGEYTPVRTLNFGYMQDDMLLYQVQTLPDGSVLKVNYSFTFTHKHQYTKAEIRNAEDELVGNLIYEYEGRTRTENHFDAEGVLLGTIQSEFDWFGRLRQTRKLDAQGELQQRVTYSYSPVHALVGWKWSVVIIIASLSIYAAQEVNMNLKQREEDKKSKQ